MYMYVDVFACNINFHCFKYMYIHVLILHVIYMYIHVLILYVIYMYIHVLILYVIYMYIHVLILHVILLLCEKCLYCINYVATCISPHRNYNVQQDIMFYSNLQ